MTAPRPPHILCVSIPRAGHHYLVSLLRGVVDGCWYCEYYTPVDCCRSVPCTRGQGSRLVLQKNHDFELDVPVDLPDVTYVIQYRDPVMAVLSDREYLARLEGRERADDLEEFPVWLGKKGAHFVRFWEKWLASPNPQRPVIEYGQLLQSPAESVMRVLEAVEIPVDSRRLADVSAEVSAFVADFPVPAETMRFERRSLEHSRYFDRELIAVYASILRDAIPGLRLAGELPEVETEPHLTLLVFKAALATARGAHGEAADHLRKACEIGPGNPFAWYELSLALMRAGDMSGAIEAAEAAARLRPTHAVLLRHVSDLFSLRSGSDLDRAIAVARDLLRVSPSDPGPLTHLASMLVRKRELTEAGQTAVRAMAGGSGDPHVWRECSEILTACHDYQGALDAINEALLRLPSNAEFHHHRGNVLAKMGRRQDAAEAHARAVELAPHEIHWRRALARELASLGRADEASAVPTGTDKRS